MAVEIPNVNRDVVILTDSASCLQALESGKSRHPWIQEVEELTRRKPVRFCWIPGHAGVVGNVEADRLANEGRAQPVADIPIPAEDAIRSIRQAVRQEWNTRWFASRDAKLREIKSDTYKWLDHNNAADQRLLTRLRIGHTRLTHTFLLKKEPPPNCECCGTTMDVRHIILQCRKYDTERHATNIGTSLRDALKNEEESETRLLSYLHQTGLRRML